MKIRDTNDKNNYMGRSMIPISRSDWQVDVLSQNEKPTAPRLSPTAAAECSRTNGITNILKRSLYLTLACGYQGSLGRPKNVTTPLPSNQSSAPGRKECEADSFPCYFDFVMQKNDRGRHSISCTAAMLGLIDGTYTQALHTKSKPSRGRALDTES